MNQAATNMAIATRGFPPPESGAEELVVLLGTTGSADGFAGTAGQNTRFGPGWNPPVYTGGC